MRHGKDKSWQYYLGQFRPDRVKLAISVVLAIFQSVLYLPIIFLIKEILNENLASQTLSRLITVALLIFGLITISFLFQIGQRYLVLHVIKRNTQKVRNDLFIRYYDFAKRFTDQHDSSYLHTVLIQDLNRMEFAVNTFFSSFIPSLFMIVMLSGALVYINPRLFLFVILLLPVLAILILVINRRLKKLFIQWRESFRNFNRGTLHILEILHLTKIQNAEQYEEEQMRKKNEQFTTLDIKIQWLQEMYHAIRANWIWLMGILVIIIGGMAVIEENMTIGDVFLFYVVFNFMKRDVGQILAAIPQFTNGKEALDRFTEVYFHDSKQPYTGTEKIDQIRTISIRDVSFSYTEGKPVLEHVSLEMEKGTVYLVKGRNGSGKTTLMHLILGFYRPGKGFLMANDIPYDSLEMRALRTHFGVVLQEAPVFSGTIAENIAYGHPEISEAEIMKACEMATVNDFLGDLTDGIHTQIGQKGVYLSGGQRQKIAIARALVSKPSFLILDEPTNHLDHGSIEVLMKNLKSLSNGPGLIIISHDDTLTRFSETILEIEGSHLRTVA